jgi:putative aminopeptidase FrvX
MRRHAFAIFRVLFSAFFLFSVDQAAGWKQELPADAGLKSNLAELVATPAVSGYETQLGEKIRGRIATLHPIVDNLGDITVTMGGGAPRRLIVTPIDEPGLIVSGITDDGYIRVQRLPQGGLPPIFNELYSAQPVKIETANGGWIDGVVAGLSVHLQPGRVNPPRLTDLENTYIDVGAASAAEVRRAGIDNLSPIAINRRLFDLAGHEFAGASIGDRFGAAALLELLSEVDASKVKGTLTVAFVVQQRTGARGLERILTANRFDEMVYVGRLLPGGVVAGAENVHRAPRREPGSGVLVGLAQTGEQLEGFAAELKQIADRNQIPFEADYSSGLIPQSYLPASPFPPKWAHIGIATGWPDTPAELIDAKDLNAVGRLLALYADAPRMGGSGGSVGSGDPSAVGPTGNSLPNTAILSRLIVAYGVSDHEGPVRDEVKRLLPPWAKPETDDAGNLILQVGSAPAGTKTPSVLIVAHMDEIGYEVKSISKDGRLEVAPVGGEDPSFYLGHPALVHSVGGDHDAIMELPNGWDEPKFEWPRGRDAGNRIRVDVGARTPEAVEKLGIKLGDTVTIPKVYRPLLGKRANGRSFDDRVGCTALISAAWTLGGPLKDHNITFAFSTAEEVGLDGAAALAKRLAVEGHTPDYVFAVDTFVSSDSPIESKRFADAPIGKGFVIRAVDNSNIVRPDLVGRVIKLARASQIPVEWGATGGGNDGSAFLRYGSLDIALGWPLRYSHSPAEVIDTRDVDALARIIARIARSW